MDRLRVAGKTLLALVMFAVMQLCASAQINSNPTASNPNAVMPVPNPCPRFKAGSVVPDIPALYSSGGSLRVSLSYQTRTDDHHRQLFCFMTPSGLENPTLHLRPGDHLFITVTNNTPRGMNPMTLDSPNCGARVMNSSSLNIHYHGTNTSPVCGQDEVIKTIINSGDTFQYNVAIPKNEPPGLYWYHPHVHGISEHAVLGGATGALVVDGVGHSQPVVAGLPTRILVIRDQPQVQGLMEGPGGCTNGVPFQDITVNNVPIDSHQEVPHGPVNFTPAVLKVAPDETQFWRVSNSSADTILDLQVQYDGVAQTLQLVAIDGVPVNSQDGDQPGGPIPVTHFRLPPAGRVEFVVTTPSPSVASAQLVTTSIMTGKIGDCDPNRPIFNIVLSGVPSRENHLADLRPDPSQDLNPPGQRFAGLAAAPVTQSRLLYFDEHPETDQFFMAVAGQPEGVFDPNAPPAITAIQGTVEQWTVQNRTAENHEFHIHQTHFLVLSQSNFEINGQPEAPAIDGQYLDMIEVPAWDGNRDHPFPSVTLLIDFRGPDIGNFVFHCHILEHEDKGMMNIIRVVAPMSQNTSGSAKKISAEDAAAVSPKLPASNAEPGTATGGSGTGAR